MPSRMTQESYRPGVSNRTMVGNSATTFAYEFQRTEWRAVMKSEHETIGMGEKHCTSSLRGLQSRSATNRNDQAAKKKRLWWAGCSENNSGFQPREKYFSLDIPLYRTSESPTIHSEQLNWSCYASQR